MQITCCGICINVKSTFLHMTNHFSSVLEGQRTVKDGQLEYLWSGEHASDLVRFNYVYEEGQIINNI